MGLGAAVAGTGTYLRTTIVGAVGATASVAAGTAGSEVGSTAVDPVAPDLGAASASIATMPRPALALMPTVSARAEAAGCAFFRRGTLARTSGRPVAGGSVIAVAAVVVALPTVVGALVVAVLIVGPIAAVIVGFDGGGRRQHRSGRRS